MRSKSRREFLKSGAWAGSALLLSTKDVLAHTGTHYKRPPQMDIPGGDHRLLTLSRDLLQTWGSGLLRLQINKPGKKGFHGGILCPACSTIHGRCGDTIFPLLYLAANTGDNRYLESALHVYEWTENNVSLPDGSWVNEVVVSDWKGTTVFGAASLAEALWNFGDLLDTKTRGQWRTRLRAAAEYIYREFTIDTGNINYPINAAYTLSLIGKLLELPHLLSRGRELAHQCLGYISPNDHLIFGEGHPRPTKSVKGCYSVDLGYNVEESLPAFVLYAKLTGDTEVLEAVMASMRAHLEFMLPDGGWDNSWGTRNFKWTYWGSRTSDGCQPAYALLAGEDPVFYKAALQNTLLLDRCTHNNLLHGGPHYHSHGILPCVHHIFGHSKALATVLVNKALCIPPEHPENIILPRDRAYGIKHFRDIDTSLASQGGWRATFTGYDVEYLMKSGHASGGALTLLWHEKTGPIVTASMNKYQLVESFNMQRDKDPRSTSLTPRLEVTADGKVYTNLNDLKAVMVASTSTDGLSVVTQSHLVDENQILLPDDSSSCEIHYEITKQFFKIRALCKAQTNQTSLRYLLPIVCSSNEKVQVHSPHKITIQKDGAILCIASDTPVEISGNEHDRLFNFVPGLEAIVLTCQGGTAHIKLSVS